MDAWKVFYEYGRKSTNGEDDDFVIEEALNSLVDAQDVAGIYNLAVHYYEQEHYDLALKYFEMAAELGEPGAVRYIGDIWRNGYTGTVDYEKAYLCYSENADHDTISKIRIADMYRGGCYVEQDHDKYCAIIEELYDHYLLGSYLFIAVPEILFRMARIYEERGDQIKAIHLLKEARNWLNEKMAGIPTLEELRMMEEIIDNLYSMNSVDEMDLFSCFYILRTPKTVTFSFSGREYAIQSVQEEEGVSVFFDGTWHRSVEDFLRKAVIGEYNITTIRDELYDFKVR